MYTPYVRIMQHMIRYLKKKHYKLKLLFCKTVWIYNASRKKKQKLQLKLDLLLMYYISYFTISLGSK